MAESSTLYVNPRTTKILVIDAQNDVCDDSSAYANSIAPSGEKRDVKPIQKAVENGITPFLGKAREHGLPIGFIQSIYLPGQYSHAGISDKWLTKNPEWRIKIYRNLPLHKEPIFLKDTQETFTYCGKDNGLDGWLQGTESVLVAGFTTDGCIKKGVYALLEKGYKPVVLEDCVATSGYKMGTAHAKTLNEFRAHKIIQVVNSKGVEF